ncbi:DUF397 domain-containing protein [Amycolatopsis antarctica]|uniref:DUF397 domain-containing protein n=1 Tax=Amycolatopsis antarctica TaxID=1854586 RepID=A0A263D2G0_9PSEU|nr:DUF397 domain-containing protein [Amycolatopsis antarctica]OZM71676.1 DUF397 domain-containing protein [Amycolatopsis antarctica]
MGHLTIPAARWRTSSYSGENGNCVEVAWRTSSHSGSNGDCVEIGWRTSSHSGGNGNCVEVAPTPAAWSVRDTKDRDGGTLDLSAPAWQALLRTLT